ncbi:serine hydrolase [Nocardia sp. MDA0666]|uniref:serine hydrolase domain-containing protein n=1 Tax=Nocardia sp. MDA0666 TaxID=2135448 RepID=UPI0018ED7B3E|nr:serine hydrolase domain-containing protein [Nocardia sp. MDA0666]
MSAMRRHRRRVALAGVGLLSALAVQACDTGGGEPTRKEMYRTVTQALDTLVRSGFPGAQVTIDGPDGHRVLTAGVGDIATGMPIADDARVRIGSNTKTFVAAVVLQLVAEGKVDLDAPIERSLPGVVQGNGNDGNRITVRQLLQHTSGLPDYLGGGDPEPTAPANTPQLRADADEIRWAHYEPEDLVRIALSMPPRFEPGERSVYTNTNYILLGMLIEKVTGRSAEAEIAGRILEPLGLRDTYFPDAHGTGIRGPHPRGYQETGGGRTDFTDLDPSWADTAGAMVATPDDLNRFFTALLAGKLLPAAQLAEMKHTLPWDRGEPGSGYGLGLIHQPVSCGRDVWGHGGSIPGFATRNGVASDGTAVVVTVNQLPIATAASDAVSELFDAAVCAR